MSSFTKSREAPASSAGSAPEGSSGSAGSDPEDSARSFLAETDTRIKNLSLCIDADFRELEQIIQRGEAVTFEKQPMSLLERTWKSLIDLTQLTSDGLFRLHDRKREIEQDPARATKKNKKRNRHPEDDWHKWNMCFFPAVQELPGYNSKSVSNQEELDAAAMKEVCRAQTRMETFSAENAFDFVWEIEIFDLKKTKEEACYLAVLRMTRRLQQIATHARDGWRILKATQKEFAQKNVSQDEQLPRVIEEMTLV